MNVTILPVRILGQYTENERVLLGNNYYLMSTQASCSVLRALHTLSHSMLTFCERHYIFTEVTESEKDQIAKAVNGRARICHCAFMDPNVCSLSTMPRTANYYTWMSTPLLCLSKKDSQFRKEFWTDITGTCIKYQCQVNLERKGGEWWHVWHVDCYWEGFIGNKQEATWAISEAPLRRWEEYCHSFSDERAS